MQLAAYEVVALRRTLARLEVLATTMDAGIELGDLRVTVGVLRRVLGTAEECE